MFKDKILAGAVIGLAADAVKLIVNYAAFQLGYTQVVFWQLIAALLLPREDIFKPLGILIGAVADITIAMFLGVVFIYYLYAVGRDHLWFKAVGFGMLVWVSLFGVLLGQLVSNKVPPDPLGILTTIVAHFSFGLSLAVFTKLLAGNMAPMVEDLTKNKTESHLKSFRILSAIPLKKLLKNQDHVKKLKKI
ncbi:MAG: hypothetical protein SCK28_01850 [Bacillota bacterium]|nr:hypothetical protein [Bacillota bacterium]